MTFDLSVMTLDKEFFSGRADAVEISSCGGRLTVLANHAPMAAVVDIGDIRICVDGQWRRAYTSGGFMEVGGNRAQLFLQACRWPEEIDREEAEHDLERAEELIRGKRDVFEYGSARAVMARAMAKLRVTSGK